MRTSAACKSSNGFFSRNDQAEAFYVIASGRVRITNEYDADEEILLDVLVPGMEFGEISILDDGRRTHNAECQGAVTLLSISHTDFLNLLRKHPMLHDRVTRRPCLYIRMAFAAWEDSLRLPLVSRLAMHLLLLAQLYGVREPGAVTINLQLSQEDLAHMLGTARQSVGKPLRTWQQAGWIRQEYRKITILDEASLAAAAKTNS